ncbi:hypothetical protein GSM42_20230 [Shimazuella sp. KC615]|uniref:histidine kinase n=2 Tax=Shimazuella alba TaxID=2690964 RepID=A0A6I4W247_9BACL|nr:hypothetical protein [Shimazuella alba]
MLPEMSGLEVCRNIRKTSNVAIIMLTKKPEPAAFLPIQDEVARLIHLVQDLHQLSLAEVGQLHLKKTNIDIVGLIGTIVNMYEVEASERGIELRLERWSSNLIPLLRVDPNRITQVFVNFITNALSHTPKEGKVMVQIEPLDQEVLVHVRDTGSGIEEEHIPFIFDRFYRADKDRSREHGGMGLGLAIAKEYVEAHKGDITVRSTKVKGTTFTVHLKYREKEMQENIMENIMYIK